MQEEKTPTPIKHGPWTITEKHLKYEHELVQVWEDDVIKPDGAKGIHAVVNIREGASVLAVDENNFAYFAQEFRYAVGRKTLEVVGGAVEEGETALETAKRELKEELGIEAEEFIALGQVDPPTSMIHSPANLFLARGLNFTKPKQEGSEQIKTIKMRLDEAVDKALNGEITHAISCVLILRANNFLQRLNER